MRELTWTDASKSSRRVDTSPAIVAGVLVETFIHIDGAELPCEAPTLAYRALQSLLADSSVLTGVRVAVFPVVTPLAAQLGRTLAVEVILEVDTFRSVQTG